MMIIIQFLLIFNLVLCIYIYFGYPLLIWIMGKLRPRPVTSTPITPLVTVIIPVYNEESVIDEKLTNTLQLTYPEKDKLEILVVSDGSTDNTENIVKQFTDPRITLLPLRRCGKVFALNKAVENARGEIVVFTDANSMLDPGSLTMLINNFADPSVGGVCGNQKFLKSQNTDTTEKGENLYWRYDKWLKNLESKVGSIFAADGSLYAIRKQLYMPVTDPAQADDIAISTRVVLQGYRLLFEPGAVTYEPPPSDSQEEFKRKIRVTNHSVRALLNLKTALWTSGFYSLELLSHKFFRHLLPFPLLALFLSNMLLIGYHPLYSTLFICQALFYVLAITGYVTRDNPTGKMKLLSIPFYFSLVNTAAFLGVISILRGKRIVAWKPRKGIE